MPYAPRLLTAFAVLCQLLLQCAPASATLFCHLRRTEDGFVALRAAPSPDAKILARMKPQDEVMIGLGEKGKWIEVTWWRGDDRLTKRYGGKGLRGWTHGALIDDMCG